MQRSKHPHHNRSPRWTWKLAVLLLPFLSIIQTVSAIAQEVPVEISPAEVEPAIESGTPSTLPNVPTSFPELPEVEEGEELPTNPLELTQPDPLLPELVVDRPLSPQEQSILDTALDELNQQAEAQLRAGNLVGALELWNRELRLRRFLGPAEEVESLSRVGEVAWRENQVTEVRLITQRLQEIEQEVAVQSPTDYALLLKIAQSYQMLRAREEAVALYDKLLVQARQTEDLAQEQQTLTALGDLHLAWFDYPNAADTYQQLLAVSQTRGDTAAEIQALQQLARVYKENNQPEQAIAILQQLVDTYQRDQQLQQISALKQEMGDAYLALNRPEAAATSYQEAFAIARSTQQYAYAADALQRLANLYVTLEQLDEAIVVYQLLLDVRQQSYDTLGMMNTYDQIGQLYRALGNNAQAATSFQRGLQLAQQLNYKVSYFQTQIQELSGP
ncbi:MAG: tetratricopeptide repeat protein [Elainellaceae cyanobacterium]